MKASMLRPRLIYFDPAIKEIAAGHQDEWDCLKAGADALGMRTLIALPSGLDHWSPGFEFVRLPEDEPLKSDSPAPQAGFERVIQSSRFMTSSASQLLSTVEIGEGDALYLPHMSVSLALGLAYALERHSSSRPRTALLFEKSLADDAHEIGLSPSALLTVLDYGLSLLCGSERERSIRLFTRTEAQASEYTRLTGRRFQTAPWPVSPRIAEMPRLSHGGRTTLLMQAFDLDTQTMEFIQLLTSEIVWDHPVHPVKLALQIPREYLWRDAGGRWCSSALQWNWGIEFFPDKLPLEERFELLRKSDLFILPPHTGRRGADYDAALVEAQVAGQCVLVPKESRLEGLFDSEGTSAYAASRPGAGLCAVLEQLSARKQSSHACRQRIAEAHSPERFARFICGMDLQAAVRVFNEGLAVAHFRVDAERPVAFNSPDHLSPHGTSQDNSRNYQFNKKLYALFGRTRLSVLDLGCAGGGFVKACLDDGHYAVGIEGSDYSLRCKRAEWKSIPDFLFTGDVSYPFKIAKINPKSGRSQPHHFDVVTSWELLEHIRSESLPTVCRNVLRHLASDGLWIMSISPQDEVIQGFRLHQTVKSRSWWIRKLQSAGLVHSQELEAYFGGDWVRGPQQNAVGSFHLILHRRGARITSPPPARKSPSRPKPCAPAEKPCDRAVAQNQEIPVESPPRVAPVIPLDSFEDPMVWESPLQRVMEDLVHEGDEVLDVGANIGALSTCLWRLVGPTGRVHSFEANPHLIDRIKGNFRHHRLPEKYVNNAAVWFESGTDLMLEIDSSYFQSGSRIVRAKISNGRALSRRISVKSLALDDYCASHAIEPSFIKVDVEGLEESVLRGASRILERCKPSIIFEYFHRRPAPALFLVKLGYRLFDVHSYQRLDPACGPRKDLRTDILAVHHGNRLIKDTPWSGVPMVREVATVPVRKVCDESGSDFLIADEIDLNAGRWLIASEFELRGRGTAGVKVLDEERRLLYYCEAPNPLISNYVCSNAVLKVPAARRITIRLDRTGPDLRLCGGRIRLSEISFGAES